MASTNHLSTALLAAIDAAGGQSALGRLIGKRQSTVGSWVQGGRPLPAEHVLKVEAATGISRHDLRPDIYPRDEHFAPSPPVAPAVINSQCDPRPVSQSAPRQQVGAA